MKRPAHIFALLLFALTQFVAPFAHAHVNGNQDSGSLHTGTLLHHLSAPGASQCHAESHESPAIEIQQEHQRDDSAAMPATPVSVVRPSAPGGTTHVSRKYDSFPRAAFAYHRPHPQAPPA